MKAYEVIISQINNSAWQYLVWSCIDKIFHFSDFDAQLILLQTFRSQRSKGEGEHQSLLSAEPGGQETLDGD